LRQRCGVEDFLEVKSHALTASFDNQDRQGETNMFRNVFLLAGVYLLFGCAPINNQSATTIQASAPIQQAVLRTPDERFQNLPGYTFKPNYTMVGAASGQSIRMHYIDEGPRNSKVILLLHGEPSWSYLYRKMIPPLVAAGYRVIAPDLPGFGRSDKPGALSDYSYSGLTAWVQEFIANLELKNITLFAQDWGGLIGLRVVAFDQPRFERVMISNTGLPDGTEPMPPAFLRWNEFVKSSASLPIGQIIEMATTSTLTPEMIAAYNAPYPDDSFKAGSRALPGLVPLTPDQPEAKINQSAWKALAQFKKPFLTAFGDSDAITRGLEKRFQREVPGAANQPHLIIQGGGHFIQEDKGEELAKLLIEFIKR
jgi:haloalkane dehalogenase